MYGINEKVYKQLINYFDKHKDIEQVILFGSRAKNNAAFNSDIDLCIHHKGDSKGSIKEEIDELIGVYSCDVVFADRLNDEMKRQIERDGIVIYPE